MNILNLVVAVALQAAPSVPFVVEKAVVSNDIVLSGTVEPKYSATVMVKWYSLLKNIAVDLNQSVREGDLLAATSLEYLDYQKRYLEGRIGFLKVAVKDAALEEKLTQQERQRLIGLAEKGIIAQSEVDRTEIQVVDGALKRMRTEKDLSDVQRELSETAEQIKKANFYAPISGVVTEILVSPKQVVGVVIAHRDTKLCRIDRPGVYIAKAIAADTQVVHLAPAMKAWIVFEGKNERQQAVIRQINQSAGNADGPPVFDVELEFERKGPIVPRGYHVRIEIPLDSRKVTSIPWNAVRTTAKGPAVLQYGKSTGWVERAVVLGARGRHRVEVISGLNPGDIVDARLW